MLTTTTNKTAFRENLGRSTRNEAVSVRRWFAQRRPAAFSFTRKGPTNEKNEEYQEVLCANVQRDGDSGPRALYAVLSERSKPCPHGQDNVGEAGVDGPVASVEKVAHQPAVRRLSESKQEMTRLQVATMLTATIGAIHMLLIEQWPAAIGSLAVALWVSWREPN